MSNKRSFLCAFEIRFKFVYVLMTKNVDRDVKNVHIFEPLNSQTFEPNITLIRLIDLMSNYEMSIFVIYFPCFASMFKVSCNQ